LNADRPFRLRTVTIRKSQLDHFGRGTFHKPPLQAGEITWQKLFLVKQGDILFSNIKAWEGAIAVATAEDQGRYGSHRYLTCVPVPGIATARFVCFHLLTTEGLGDIREASPGSADRNRTLNTKALEKILVPTPSFEKQTWFDDIWSQVHQVRRVRSDAATELDSLGERPLSISR
jgi:type I restriction enzyme S subunit